jgi:hypothetical protein
VNQRGCLHLQASGANEKSHKVLSVIIPAWDSRQGVIVKLLPYGGIRHIPNEMKTNNI